MYKAYFSNSLDKFIDDYSWMFFPQDLFDRSSVFVIQNRNMEEWLKLELADKTGVFAGINFQFQDETIRNIISLSPEVAEELKIKKTIYLDDLKLIIFHTLNNIFSEIQKYPEFEMLQSYVNCEYPLSGGEIKNIRSSRLYRLSDSIAGLFHHYGLNSPEMIDVWEKRNSYAAETEFSYLEDNEKWQRTLWDIIFGKSSLYLHPGQIISGILNGKYNLPEINKKIIIFGSSFLSEQAVEFFHHLSSNCGSEIHHFILSPSPCITETETEKSLILSQWGNIVTGLADLLVEKDIEIVNDYVMPAGGSSNGSSMLSSLKNAVFNNYRKCLSVYSPDDSSLRVIAVPGKKREIEILKNNIINLIMNEGYNYHDIGVAAPDINTYAPYIDSVFPSGDPSVHIPYNLMDVSFSENSDYLNGFFALLDLTGSRFSRKQLFSLFRNRCFMNKHRLSDSDVDSWLEICSSLFIKWGYDSRHREEITGRKSDFATWKKALERVSSGFLFNDDESVKFASGSEIIPFHFSGGSGEKSAASLFQAVNQLYEQVYNLRFSEYEIPVWAVAMENMADFFLQPVYGTNDDNDRKFLKNVFRQINTLVIENSEAESISHKAVPYSLYKTLIDEFAGKNAYCRGQYLSDGISFSSLKPLRAIPFKVIFLLGMDENSFPGREKNRNYDLRSLTPRSIDLSVQNTDCFTFLETILSAEEKLFISYTGTNIVTGETLEPSTLVTEIKAVFDAETAEKMTVKHPLHSFNKKYFENTDSFRDFISYDKLDYDAASAVIKYEKKKPDPVALDTGYDLPDNPTADTDIYHIEEFLKYPVSFFLKNVEGIKETDISLLENDETEDFSLSYSDSRIINRAVAENVNADEKIFTEIIETGKLAGTLNNCSVADYECILSKEEYDDFTENLKNGGYFDSQPVEAVLGERRSKGNSRDICFPEVMIAAENGNLNISGTIRDLRRKGEDWYCINYDSERLRNMVSPFFRYLILRKVTGDKKISLTVFDREGKVSAVITDNDFDIDGILSAIAYSYIESFNTPVTADIQCLAMLVKNRKNILNSDDFFSSVENYYMSSSFSDVKYLNSGMEIKMNYKRDDFYTLFKRFYSCLDFKKKRG